MLYMLNTQVLSLNNLIKNLLITVYLKHCFRLYLLQQFFQKWLVKTLPI